MSYQDLREKQEEGEGYEDADDRQVEMPGDEAAARRTLKQQEECLAFSRQLFITITPQTVFLSPLATLAYYHH